MSASKTQRTILIVEDDANVRRMFTLVLQEEGYHVLTAPNGEEALAILRSSPARPCVILLDLHMPVMSGWEFRSEQKRDSAIADIPVIVASADRSLSQQPFSIDAQGYYQKPVNFTALLQHLKELGC